ncbi:MAG TPA: NAD(P)H-dependent glycerol-3-phosphate dehydrogenase, partial [Xylella fastidiosa subsp. pauca]
ISEAVRAVLREEITPYAGMKALLAREQKPEYLDILFKANSSL